MLQLLKMNKIKLFPYSGNKLWFSDEFNKIVSSKLNGANPSLLIEPFCGSAAISLNSNAEVIKINDFDENIYLMLYSVINSDYKKYKKAVENVFSHGDIKQSKDAYYKFRNTWNEKFYNSKNYKTNITAGLYLLVLAGACINNMLRFSKAGMNQSWGNRHFEISEYSFNKVSNNKNITLTNLDFYSDEYQNSLRDLPKNSVIFLDPPYEFREMTYNRGFKTYNFIDLIKEKEFAPNSLIMYTDFENDVSDKLLEYGFYKQIIREMKSTSPNRKNENKTGNEVLYIRNPI